MLSPALRAVEQEFGTALLVAIELRLTSACRCCQPKRSAALNHIPFIVEVDSFRSPFAHVVRLPNPLPTSESLPMSDQTTALQVDPAAPVTVAAGTFNLAQAIREKLTIAAISPASAAKAIGVSYVALLNVINKGSKPNSRTAAKFAAWLGVDAELINNSPKAARAPKAEKSARKSTRVDTVKAPKSTHTTAEVLAIVKAALSQTKAAKPAAAHPILKDKLALAVHGADKKQRAMVDLVLSKFA